MITLKGESGRTGECVVIRRRRVGALCSFLLAGSVAVALLDAGTDPDYDPELAERGRDLYRIYCQNCHGEAGRGDGPTAEKLEVKPSDLTRLSRRNKGEFPFDEAYVTIAGRDDLSTHRRREMPIWGIAFQEWDTDVDQAEQARERILQLIEYLKSIQR